MMSFFKPKYCCYFTLKTMKKFFIAFSLITIALFLQDCSSGEKESSQEEISFGAASPGIDSIHNPDYPNMPYVKWEVWYQQTYRDTLQRGPALNTIVGIDRVVRVKFVYKQGKRSVGEEEFKLLTPEADRLIHTVRIR